MSVDFKKAKEVKITDYARHMGYTIIRKGKFFSLKEHDSVMISSAGDKFWRNSGIGSNPSGSSIDFVVNMTGCSELDAAKKLLDFAGLPYEDNPEQTYEAETSTNIDNIPSSKELKLPQRGTTLRNVYGYLIKTRAISKDVVDAFVNAKMLYQDDHANCVFVSHENGEAVFACKRGTNTEKRFVADVSGSDYEKGFYINNGSKQLIVTESVIDAMSIMTILDAQGKNFMSINYMALSGVTKEKALLNQIERNNIRDVIICFDNDEAGVRAGEKLYETLKKETNVKNIAMPADLREKDWNAALVKYKDDVANISFRLLRIGGADPGYQPGLNNRPEGPRL